MKTVILCAVFAVWATEGCAPQQPLESQPISQPSSPQSGLVKKPQPMFYTETPPTPPPAAKRDKSPVTLPSQTSPEPESAEHLFNEGLDGYASSPGEDFYPDRGPSFDEGVCEIATRLNPRQGNLRIALGPIKATGASREMARRIWRKLQEYLTQQQVYMLATDLNAIWQRLEFEKSVIFDRKTCVQWGEFEGAQALVVGKLNPYPGNRQELFLDLLEVKTARILKSASVVLPSLPTEQKIPEEARAYQNGKIFLARQEYERAIASFTRALDEEGEEAVYYFNRGLCYSRLRDDAKALADYDRAIELDPHKSSFFNYRGMLYHRKKDYSQAQSDYNKAIELDPQNGYAYSNLGNIYIDQKEYGMALTHHQQAARFQEHDGQILYNLACAYALNRRADEALKTLQEAFACGASKEKARRDRDLEILRQHPQFQELVK